MMTVIIPEWFVWSVLVWAAINVYRTLITIYVERCVQKQVNVMARNIIIKKVCKDMAPGAYEINWREEPNA